MKMPDEDAFDRRRVELLEGHDEQSSQDVKHCWETKTILAIVVLLWANAIMKFV